MMQNHSIPTTRKILLPALCSAMLWLSTAAFAQTPPANSHSDAKSTASASTTAPLVLDLNTINDELAAASAPVNGLWQKVLLNDPHVTLVLLSFETGGVKANHSAPGVATITVMEGSVEFSVHDQQYTLAQGQVIILQPNIIHNLKASEKSLVLVNISKSEKSGHPPKSDH